LQIALSVLLSCPENKQVSATCQSKGRQIVLVFQQHQGQWHSNVLKPGNSGFSLIEVLVASTVFSLGLAGFSALLLASII